MITMKKLAKRSKLFFKLFYAIVVVYIRLYPKCVLNSITNRLGPLIVKKNKSSDGLDQNKIDNNEDDEDEDTSDREEFDLKRELKFESKIGKLKYGKMTSQDVRSVERLVYEHVDEKCERLFEVTIENYQFRLLTFVLFVFNFVCFLVQEFNWSRTIVFVVFQILLTNLPFWIYLLNLVQYYKMRFSFSTHVSLYKQFFFLKVELKNFSFLLTH